MKTPGVKPGVKRGRKVIAEDVLASGPLELSDMNNPFDRLVALACTLFDKPHGMVSVVGQDRTQFRSYMGLGMDQIPRDMSVSNLLMGFRPGEILSIPDSALDARVHGHPFVVGPPYLRSFLGTIVCDADDQAVGAIGVMDVKPGAAPTEKEIALIRLLAKMAGNEMDQLTRERAQAEKLETLRLAEQMTGVGTWRWDVATNAVTWSEEVYRIHGRDPATFNPSLDDVFACYRPDSREALQAMVQHSVATGEGYNFHGCVHWNDGQTRAVEAKAACELDDEGRVVALFGVFQDVTSRDAATTRLVESEARYRLLAENVGDVICLIQPGGLSNYISPAWQALTGFSPEEAASRTLQDCVHPEDRTRVQAVIAKGMAGTLTQRLQHRMVRKDESVVWVESHFQAVRADDGKVNELVAVIRDVSDRKALEDSLTQALDSAEAAALAKSDFLANMSHELRTPLTSVIGFAGLLQASEGLAPMERLYADRIGTGSEALLSVINDILDYSKLEAGAVEMDPLPFDPRALAQGAAALIEGQRLGKGLTLNLVIDDTVPERLVGDEGRLRQVLLNLLSNALKFTNVGGIGLTLGATPALDGGWTLRIAVSDSGIGVAASKLNGLFDRFTQADTSTTRTYGGTGLGLAISRRLVAVMGGDMGVESVPGRGSTFWFTVPLLEACAVSMTTDIAEPATMGRARILVADDAPANRELVTAILQGLGLDVETVTDGAEAVAAVIRGGFDLVLMDVQMPGMDGLTATRMIRQMAGKPGAIPILALTANVQAEHVLRCQEAGMDGHVSKPINVAALAAALAESLKPQPSNSRPKARIA